MQRLPRGPMPSVASFLRPGADRTHAGTPSHGITHHSQAQNRHSKSGQFKPGMKPGFGGAAKPAVPKAPGIDEDFLKPPVKFGTPVGMSPAGAPGTPPNGPSGFAAADDDGDEELPPGAQSEVNAWNSQIAQRSKKMRGPGC